MFGDENEERPVVCCRVDGREYEILVDSGAKFSLWSCDNFASKRLPVKKIMTSAGILYCKGPETVKCWIEGKDYEVDVF